MVVEGRAVELAQRGHAHQRHGRTRTATPGTRRLERLNENLGAADIHLTADDLAAIDTAATEITVLDDRYPEAMQSMIDR